MPLSRTREVEAGEEVAVVAGVGVVSCNGTFVLGHQP
jgi:hypothetical protein